MKDKDKGVVFGSGFLGSRIGKELKYRIVQEKEIDITDSKNLESFLDSEKPYIVINAAGRTEIDWCETHKKETRRSNVLGAANLSRKCSQKGIYFVHLSTGCIYNGNNNGKGYSEEDEPNFYGNYYAITKIEAERRLKNFPGLILRLRLPIDDRLHERNLIDKLKKYTEVLNVQNSMTTVPHMIKAMDFLIKDRKIGTYNFVNPGTISAEEIMKMYEKIVKPNHRFEAVSLEELEKRKITRSKRANCYLNTDKLQKELKGSGCEFPEIHDAVRECLISYKKAVMP